MTDTEGDVQVEPGAASLTSAVDSLTDTVKALHTTVKESYVQRAEIEQLITKKDRRKRTIFATLIVIASMFGAGVVVLATTSYCFLQGEKRAICILIPGYNRTMDDLIGRRNAVQERDIRLSVLEQEVRELQDRLNAG